MCQFEMFFGSGDTKEHVVWRWILRRWVIVVREKDVREQQYCVAMKRKLQFMSIAAVPISLFRTKNSFSSIIRKSRKLCSISTCKLFFRPP